MSQNQLLGNIGYNLTQAESSMDYIQSLKGEKLKMEEKEFQDKCKLTIELINKNNKKLKKISSINEENDDDDEDYTNSGEDFSN